MKEIRVKFTSDESMYLAIYRQIKDEIKKGNIKPNEKLPSKRALASSLNVSINTIMNAYSLLEEEEYVYSKEKSGYFVASNKHYKVSDKIEGDNISLSDKYRYDFSSESISLDLFPFFTFKKVTNNVLLNHPNIWLTKADPLGDVNLRTTIADYLYRNKGMDVTYQNVIIVSSLEKSLEIIDSLVNINLIGVEEYSYQKVINFFSNRNKKIVYIPLDKEGVKVNQKTDLLYTTPYNQFPLGIVMSNKRKNEVLSSGCKYILEDDYDCDLLTNKKIVSTLFSLDNEKVFYHGSFAHSICAGLRISYLVVPSKFINKLYFSTRNSSSSISSLDQAILNEFIKEGHYFRHLNKLKKSLLETKDRIRYLLSNNKEISFQENPLSFIIEIKKKYDDKFLKEELKRNGVKIRFLSSFTKEKQDNRILLCFSSLKKDDVEKGINLLFDIISSSIETCKE